MPQVQIMPVAVSAGVGAADGWLARRDANDPQRWQSPMRQQSLWLEGGAAIAGGFMTYQGRTPNQLVVGEALLLSSVALLTRRAGVNAAQSQETPSPTAVTTFPQPAGVAAPQVFKGMRTARAQFQPTPVEERALASQNAFI